VAVVSACASLRAWLAAVGLLLAACDSGSNAAGAGAGPLPAASAVRATGFDPGPGRTPADYLNEPELAAADVARGELLGLACAACHKFRAEEGTLIGPNLHGVFGRRAGSIEGFAYSPALAQSGLVWTPRAVAAWLENPAGFVEGTTMAFTGYRSAADRRDLIAYLLRAPQ
jgi:cytochrome c